jgi:diguanylate cyclase (GGDEF)-like protein
LPVRRPGTGKIDQMARKDSSDRGRRRLEVLYDVTRQLAVASDTEAVLDLIVTEATRLLGGDAAGLRLLEGDELVLRAQTADAASAGFRTRLKVGQSLSGRAVATGRPVVVEDLAQDRTHDPAHKQGALAAGLHGYIAIPLRAHQRTVGVLYVLTKQRRRFRPDEISLLSAFGDQASVAIDRARMLHEARDRTIKLRALVQLNHVVFSSLTTRQVLHAITGAAADLMGVPLVSIWSADEASETLELRALSDDLLLATHPAPRRRFGEGGLGWVATHRRPLNQPNVPSNPLVSAWFQEHGFTSVYAMPIAFRDSLLGVIALYGREPLQIGSDEQELLDSFVAQAALAMRNARLHDELQTANTSLERRMHELDLLTRMGELLQACASEAEAHAVVGRFAGAFFPEEGGAVFVTSASKNMVEVHASWGPPIAEDGSVFRPEDCWALRRGRMHAVEDTTSGLLCRHLPKSLPLSYVCIPLQAQGESFGLLYVGGTGGTDGARGRLAQTVGEQLGLALANLRLRDVLRNQSIRDPLTGLFNRRYMEETLERELRRCERRRQALGVIMLDLDHFKRFNDTHGHEAGNTLLAEVGRVLRTSMRDADVACRYGGEEFVLLLPEVTLAVAQERARAILETLRRVVVVHREQPLGSITASAGVAAAPEHGSKGSDVLEVADAALYRAKGDGRDRVIVAG